MDERIRIESEFGTGVRHDSPGEPVAARWHGIEQTIASVILGSIGALSGPQMALLIRVIEDSNFRGIDRVAVGALGILGTLGGLFVVAVSIFGVVFGIVGMLAARRQGRSAALGLTGVFLCGLDSAMWLGLVVCWILAVVNHR
jgi:hypothetical protein